jgi:hypothetical protein
MGEVVVADGTVTGERIVDVNQGRFVRFGASRGNNLRCTAPNLASVLNRCGMRTERRLREQF